MDDKGRAEAKLPRIYDIPLSEIDDFPDHPFQVRMDEDMEQLVESVKERGIITPIIIIWKRNNEVGKELLCQMYDTTIEDASCSRMSIKSAAGVMSTAIPISREYSIAYTVGL